MSIVEEAKRSNDPERHDTGHLSDVSVSLFSLALLTAPNWYI